jgi:L-lactate dehydrogenase (cytochrome)
MSRPVASVEDLRLIARRRLPRALFDYVDGAADAEITARANRRAFEEIEWEPRMGIRGDERDQSVELFGRRLELSTLLAPCGFVGMLHPDGEVGAAAAAAVAGTVFIASTLAVQPIEEVAAAAPGRTWLQLYTIGGRGPAEALLARAAGAGVEVLVVTVDTSVAGLRERDVRNRAPQLLASGPFADLDLMRQFATRPGWVLGHLRARRAPVVPNVVVDGSPFPLAKVGPELSRSAVVWEDLAWLREVWPGPIVIKGLLGVEDARRALEYGADGLVVSNHGGRQLDCVRPSFAALAAIVEVVEGRVPVLLDSGIRRGSDVVAAHCLGADAVLLGRAYAYGLAAGGRLGVATVLEVLRSGVERTLGLLGCSGIGDVGPDCLRRPRPGGATASD